MDTGTLARGIAHARFNRLYREQGHDLLAYVLRRVEDPETAADLVAESFIVAWRRLDQVPVDESARLWLYGVARRVIANQHRAERRRTRLGARLAESLRTELATRPDARGKGPEILRAMRGLSDEDRELLLLVSWEELSPREVATILGISSLAARSRLHRARRRLRALLEERESASGLGNPEPEMEEAR
jgi:RNA polymerase sigma factor (sigma-70 family)